MMTRKGRHFLTLLLLGLNMTGCMTSCAKSSGGETDTPSGGGNDGGYQIPNVPAATPIDPDFVGTWYPLPTLDHPLSQDWENKTFVGSEGFADYRTMVYTADGKNAIEYTAVLASGTGYFYKVHGNLVQQGTTLHFYPSHGFIRIHKNGSIETDRAMTKTDFNRTTFSNTITNCQVSTNDGVTTLTGRRDIDVRYRKATGSGGGGTPAPGGVYSTPPSSGTHVKIGTQYYPTVTIGNQEWMAVNYAGPSPLTEGSVQGYSVVEDGKYYSWRDAEAVANPANGLVPAGWRLPTRQDFITLLASQGITITDLGYTATIELNDGTEGAKNLYKLLANARWAGRLDNGGSTSVNATGFSAIPSDFKNTLGGGQNGYNANCYLWTSTSYEDNTSQAWNFSIRRFSNSITANLDPINKGGSSIILYPFRLVRDK